MSGLSPRRAKGAVISVAFLTASCLLVAGLLLLFLPRRFGPSDVYDIRVVGVCAALGLLLFVSGVAGARPPAVQGLVPAALLVAIYGKRLSDRDATADMWALTLIYPVLPALLIAAFACPWLGRRFRLMRDPVGKDDSTTGPLHL